MALNKKLICLLGAAGGYAAWRIAAAQVRQFDFRDRVVMITGSSRGLGLVLARQFADLGARLALCARDEAELERASSELLQRGATVFASTCDITQPEQIQRFCTQVRDELGPIDVLVNNAGVMQVGPMETMTKTDFVEAMATHCWAVLNIVEAVLPDMRDRGEGRIVNIASIGGQIAVPHMMPYCTSKFALVGLSDGLRGELAQEGIRVTTVCPGLMRTGSPRNAWFKGKHQAEYAWFSISGSQPLLSISAEAAARKIIDACRKGRAKVTLSLPAKLAVYANALAPELTSTVLELANRFLPAAGGIGASSLPGHQSESSWSPSILTRLNDLAAHRNNEIESRELAERAHVDKGGHPAS